MNKATTDILQIKRGNLNYLVSIIEKQNDSGIFFNDRIFFLLSEHHIGYLSDIKTAENAQKINFQKAKTTVLLSNIKSILIKGKELSIKFMQIDSNKRIERTWLFNMHSDEQAKKWYERLQKEKVNSLNKKDGSVSLNQEEKQKEQTSQKIVQATQQKIESPQKDKKQFEISRSISLSSNVMKEKEVRQIGIGVSPKNSKLDSVEQLSRIINHNHQPNIQKPDQTDRSVTKSNQNKIDDRSLTSQTTNKFDLLSNKNEDSSVNISKDSSIAKPTTKEPINQKKAIIGGQKLQKQYDQSDYSKVDQLIDHAPLSNQRYFMDKTKINADRNTSNKKPALSILKEQDQFKYSQKHKFGQSSIIKLADSSFKISSNTQLPWTYKYIKYNYQMFQQFQSYTQLLMQDIIYDQVQPSEMRMFKSKLVKRGVHYFDVDEVEVKLAMMNLYNAENQRERVCNKMAIRQIQNQFSNFSALYQYLGDCQNLKVPLVSLCEYQGFVALFKVTPKILMKQINVKQIQTELKQLQRASKIQHNFFQKVNRVIVQLDETYYQKLKPIQDEHLNFHCFFIQQNDQYLLPDLLTDLNVPTVQPILLLRKELIANYTSNGQLVKNAEMTKTISFGLIASKSGKQVAQFSKNLLKALADAITQLDSAQRYFINSQQLKQYLHSKGINIRYLGHLHLHLQTPFHKKIIMAEMAARSCKSLLRNTLQDIIVEQGRISDLQIKNRVCDLMNCVLGNTYETVSIWKVVAAHNRAYFNVDLNVEQIDRCHFVIAVIQNCRLNVVWEKIKVEQAFRNNTFFNQRNFIGLRFKHKFYQPCFHQEYLTIKNITENQENSQGFDKIVDLLQLKQQNMPHYLSPLKQRINKYLSYFLNPQQAKQQFSHLNLFKYSNNLPPSKANIQMQLMQIKWWLKLKNREQYVRCCDQFIKSVTFNFGQFHPAFSQLYDLFSAYHLSCSQYEDAVTFAKSSLVNILKIFGINHQRTSQCYYHLALCYIKAGLRDQAIAHIKKAKSIFQNSGKSDSVAYAIMLLKLGLLYLNQSQVDDCISSTAHALQLLQSGSEQMQIGYQDQIVECYQMLTRCFQINVEGQELDSLAVECSSKLACIKKVGNMQKMAKISLYPFLTKLSAEAASIYLDIISIMPIENTQQNYITAYHLIKQRVMEDTLISNLQLYLSKLTSIAANIQQKRLLQQWQGLSSPAPRESVKDFISLTMQLLLFLGDGFISGCLREAL